MQTTKASAWLDDTDAIATEHAPQTVDGFLWISDTEQATHEGGTATEHALSETNVQVLADQADADGSTATEHAVSEAIVPVLFNQADAAVLRSGSTNNYHREARDILQNIYAQPPGDIGGVFDLTTGPWAWPHWRNYLAHLGPRYTADPIVGPGVTALTAEFITGTIDPNRGGRPRLDIVVYHVDGGSCRLHPGSKPKNDAQPVFFPPSPLARIATNYVAPLLEPERPALITATAVPQVDRLGKKEAWRRLTAIRDATEHTNPPEVWLELTDGNLFPWWQWFPNLGRWTAEVRGAGIMGVFLDTRPYAYPCVTLRVHHCDGTECLLWLREMKRGDIALNFEEQVATED